MKRNKILIITGGTGGHVIPALNFFNYISNNSKNVFLITDNRGYKFISNANKKNIFKSMHRDKIVFKYNLNFNNYNSLNFHVI